MGDIHTFDHNMFPLSGSVGRFLSLEVFFFNFLLSNFSNFLSSLGLFTAFLFLGIIRLWVVLFGAWLVGRGGILYTGGMHTCTQAGIIQVSYRYRTGRRGDKAIG